LAYFNVSGRLVAEFAHATLSHDPSLRSRNRKRSRLAVPDVQSSDAWIVPVLDVEKSVSTHLGAVAPVESTVPDLVAA
jgi:hypothetical protein